MRERDYECVVCVDDNYVLLHDLHLDYFDEYEGMVDITIPSGYRCDMGIYSDFFLSVIQPKRYVKILIVYEFLCTHPEYERTVGFNFYKEEADQLFVDGLIALGAPKWKRLVCYVLLRINRHSWKQFRER